MAHDPKKIQADLDQFIAEWDQIKAAPEYKPFVAGEYVCVFDHEEAEGYQSPNTKRSGFRMVFKVVEGDYEGRFLSETRWLRGEPQALAMTKRDMAVLGYEAKTLKLQKLPAIEGQFTVKIDINLDPSTRKEQTAFLWIRRG